jgi:subtilisin family serine protease
LDLVDFERIFRGHPKLGPHTIRSPVRYEVWRDFALNPGKPIELLLEAKLPPGYLLAADALIEGLDKMGVDPRGSGLAVSDDVVAITLPFPSFLRVLIPLTDWGVHAAYLDPASVDAIPERELTRELAAAVKGEAPDPNGERRQRASGEPWSLDRIAERRWFAVLVAQIGLQGGTGRQTPTAMARWLRKTFRRAFTSTLAPLESISVNRVASTTVSHSRVTVKADAAARLFDIDASGIGWAIVDSGIDATHPAFRRQDVATGVPHLKPFEKTPSRWENWTRIKGTFDLLEVRQHLQVANQADLRSMDIGDRIERHCQVPMTDEYRPPGDEHGTHVAGVLGANWTHTQPWSPTGDAPWEVEVEPLIGICPTVMLWDFRVLGSDGRGDEFSILTALNHILRINADEGRLVIQGVNLSLSITHDVANYACGWTPICQACERLVDSGVVVVVSAGNTGFRSSVDRRIADGTNYLPISITDPGNAERVLTVGATHRVRPYRYGVSYFSSRGPTADGRRKPDLLAPGEGIVGPVGSCERTTLDGTSQAAPHVSGAAALLLARYPELAGQPERVKGILCDSASDLGRDPAFQGHGLIDILRALQSI